MKKMFFALLMMLTHTMAASAMSYEQARNEALFLTDKMAYELNLTDEQYEAAYEINLDYLMGVTGRADVFGTYWERRNLDLSYILFDWQWNAYIAASYFYRPLYWDAGYWHFGVYARYPQRDFFYFGRPHFYATYHGGHAWHVHGGNGYYYGYRDRYRIPDRNHFGMHDRWNRGDFHSPRHSSSRITGPNGGRDTGHRPNNGGINRRPGNEGMNHTPNNRGSHQGNGSFGGYRGNGQNPSKSTGNYDNRPSRHSGSSGSGSHSTPSRNYGSGSHSSSPSRSFGSSSHSSRSSYGGGNSHSRSFSSSSHSSRSSYGGGSHRSSRSSFGGSTHSSSRGSSHSGGHHSGGSHSGGGHFGGHR